MTATIPRPRAANAEPEQPQPSRTTPWNDPAPIRPTGPQYTGPDRYAVTVGRAQGAHDNLISHLDGHGDDCGPRCPEFAKLVDAIGTALDKPAMPTRLQAVA